MYIKYVSNGVASTDFSYFYNDLAGILNGTITSAAQLNSTTCNTADSEVIGTLPSNGIYTVDTVSTTQVDLTKKHYASNGAFQPTVKFSIRHANGGPMLYTTDANNANALITTYPLTSGSAVTTGNRWDDIIQVDIWIGDTGIMVAAQGGLLGFNEPVGSLKTISNIWCDFPLIEEYDSLCFSEQSAYYPGAFVAMGGIGVTSFGASPNNGSSNHDFVIGRFAYKIPNNSYLNKTTVQGSSNMHHYGNITQTEYVSGQPAMFPPPQSSVFSVPTTNGTGTILHPCVYISSWTGQATNTNSLDDTRVSGQLLNFYRIADNFGTYKHGDRIQVGSDYYRVIKGHKTGIRLQHNATECACYAVPENSIPGPT